MNIDHRQYPRCHCHHRRRLRLRMGGSVVEAGGGGDAADEALPLRICSQKLYRVIILYSMDCICYDCCCLSLSWRSYSFMYLRLASSSCLYTDLFSAWTSSRLDFGLVPVGTAQTQSLKNMICYKSSISRRSTPCSSRRSSGPISYHH